MEPHPRAAPFTFASGLEGRGDILPRKQDIAPFSSPLLLAEICAANRFTPLPAQASPLCPQTELQKGGLWHVSICWIKSLIETGVCAWGWCQFFLFSPREVMHLGQHREDRLFLNVFLNLLSSSLNCMEVEVLGMVYNWKCTYFPSRSLWASSWFYHCPGQQFSALSTCS